MGWWWGGVWGADPQRGHREVVQWQPVDLGWITINFDEAFKGNTGPSSIGVVAIREDGSIMAMLAKQIVDGINNQAKYLAM